jgi:hypothetical protein
MRAKKVISLLSNANAQTVGDVIRIPAGYRTIQAVTTGAGAVSATVEFYGSNTGNVSDGILLATSVLSGTNSDTTGAVITAEYDVMWAKLTAISGTGAVVSATVAV